MNNLVLDRINQQLTVSKKEIQVAQPAEVEERREVNALPPDELKKLFMDELAPTPLAPEGERIFNGIEDFVSWYLGVKDQFSEGQVVALSTLVQTANLINIGCACKKANRINQANDYYRIFWTKNMKTDLPSKVHSVSGVSSVSFAVGGDVFAKYPTLTPEKV
jgi:hypothetical protein